MIMIIWILGILLDNDHVFRNTQYANCIMETTYRKLPPWTHGSTAWSPQGFDELHLFVSEISSAEFRLPSASPRHGSHLRKWRCWSLGWTIWVCLGSSWLQPSCCCSKKHLETYEAAKKPMVSTPWPSKMMRNASRHWEVCTQQVAIASSMVVAIICSHESHEVQLIYWENQEKSYRKT